MKDLDVARQRDQKACPASCLWTTVFFHPSARVFFVHRRCYKRSTSTKKDGLIQSSVAGRQRRRKPQQSTIHRGLVFLLSIGTVIISLMFMCCRHSPEFVIRQSPMSDLRTTRMIPWNWVYLPSGIIFGATNAILASALLLNALKETLLSFPLLQSIFAIRCCKATTISSQRDQATNYDEKFHKT